MGERLRRLWAGVLAGCGLAGATAAVSALGGCGTLEALGVVCTLAGAVEWLAGRG